MNATDAVRAVVPHLTPAQSSGTGSAPANIALCKYWGKRNEELKLPVTGSLSVSLGSLGTRTTVHASTQDRFQINGEEQKTGTPAARRLFSYLDFFREPGLHLEVTSENSIPTAAGLASSASGFAALVRALDDLFQWQLPSRDLSILARLGSGSASRSLEHGFVEWQAGKTEDGSDSMAVRLPVDWPEFRIGILTLSRQQKAVSSGEGMRRTAGTSVLYRAWPDEVSRALPVIRTAVLQKEFYTLGAAAEQNALAMHATMLSAWPPILYWTEDTVKTLHQVHTLRAEGCPVYATMDAGPNVKLLFLQDQESRLRSTFPDLHIVRPFS
jgi:diphosphomevalonate decarboxylase